MKTKKLKFIVLGAGVSGILVGKRLLDEGFDNFVIYEKAGATGGTWRDARYPGIACDTPAHVYCYTFELNPDWSKSCAPGVEINNYLKFVSDKYAVTPHIKFNTEITNCEFRDGRWHVRSANGMEDNADVLITATGALTYPSTPDIPGLGTFKGPCMHTHHWQDGLDLKGKRVGIVGGGASAVQIITDVGDKVGHLTSFQRTVQWIYPWPHETYDEKRRRDFREHPETLKALNQEIWSVLRIIASFVIDANSKEALEVQAACEKHLEEKVKDPALRKKLTPNYRAGCKRMIFNSGYYEAMQLPTTELVTEKIECIEPNGIRTADGRLHELDVLVLATGYRTGVYMLPSIKIVGRNGNDLATVWKESPFAYRTVSLPDFPNMFMMIGPGSPIGNFSLMTVAEILFDYMLPLFNKLRDGECREINASREATERYCKALVDAMPGTIWMTGCKSWYLGPKGIPDTWAWSVARFEEEFKQPNLRDFEMAV